MSSIGTAVGFLPQWEQIGPQFVEHYYRTFCQNREGVMGLYHQDALLTFENHMGRGLEEIRNIITTKVTFGNIQHQITKVDCQPTIDMGIMIMVTGLLKTDEDHPLGFNQAFLLKAFNGTVLIMHDIFRLSLHDTT